VVTVNPKECTHIVTSRIARTIKFLSGISVCGYVVTPKWVEESGKAGIFRDEEEFLLQDTNAEQLLGMSLSTSLSCARRKKLLEGAVVYATPSVEPPRQSLNDIISCAGGKLLSLSEIRALLAGNGGSKPAPSNVIVLTTCADIENNCCKEFTEKNISKCDL
jgi:PAX-interacting protein 1